MRALAALRSEQQGLSSRLDTHIALQKQRNDTDTKSMEAMKHHVYGNGKPGLLTRVDRIEQRAKTVLWFAATGASTASVLLITDLYRAITG